MIPASVFQSFFADAQFEPYPGEDGLVLPLRSRALEAEYRALRGGIALADLSAVHVYEVAGEEAMDLLDFLLTGPVARLREEHVLHTLLVDEQGEIISDVYVVNLDGERYLLLADGATRAELDRLLTARQGDHRATVQCRDQELALFSVDGPYSWAPVKSLFGPEILGLRYLGCLTTRWEGQPVHVLRAGKTGEYGYWVLAPRASAATLFGRMLPAAQEAGPHPVSLCGRATHRIARLENHFFDLDLEGKHTRNPFEVGLFWAIQPNKSMMATDALQGRQRERFLRRVVGFRVDGQPVEELDTVCCGEVPIGQVVALAQPPGDGRQIGLALLEKRYGHSGITYGCRGKGATLTTISLPFIKNKSLTVKIT